MSTRYLEALFNPRSIVVLGASESPDNLGGMVLRNLMSSEYTGELTVINPTGYASVHGIPCVRKISKLPSIPDLAIVCTPPETVPKLVRQLGNDGVRTAMVLTGGLSRTHSKSGRPLMYAVQEAAKETGIRILGPNTIGLMVPGHKLNATYMHMGVLPGKIAFIGQSGAIASTVIDWAFARGVGFSHFLTLGDSMDIDLDDLIDYLAQDRHTRAILLHIENITNPARFLSAARAASRTKPVIAVKSGRVPEAQWEPMVPPKGIINGDIVYDAALRRAGILRVNGLDEMFDAIETLTRMRAVKHDQLVVMCNGFGPGVLAVDRLASLGGELADLSDNSIDEMAKLLPPYWTRRNPIDLNYDASPQTYVKALEILARDPAVSNVLVMYAPSLTEDSLQVADAVVTAVKKSRLNVFTCWLGQSTVTDAREEFYRAGLPTFFSPEKAVKSFMHHVNHMRSQRLLRETPSYFIDRTRDREHARSLIKEAARRRHRFLSHQEARRFIADYGIPTVATWYCDDVDEVVERHRELGTAINLTLVHEHSAEPFLEEQTGRGRYKATIRRLNDDLSIRQSCAQLLEQYREHFPRSGFLGFAIQESQLHVGGIGFSLGITRDPVFGPLIVCGAAGISVNVVTDRRVALPPLNMALARDLLRQTYMYRLLQEYSYRPEQDIQATCHVLITLSQIIIDNPEIEGLEIMPLLFDRDNAIAVDVAVSIAKPMRMAIQPYPEHMEEWIILPRSGRKALFRPVRAEDEPAHLEFHLKQSPETIRYRFFHYRKHFTHDDVAQMVQIDYDREMVFIVFLPKEVGKGGETLGSVRTWTDADNLRCEFAVMVRDDMRGEGLGMLMMNKMIEYSRSRGTVEMIGTVLPDNEPMLKLGRRLGFEIKAGEDDDVMELRLPLNEPSEHWQQERLKAISRHAGKK